MRLRYRRWPWNVWTSLASSWDWGRHTRNSAPVGRMTWGLGPVPSLRVRDTCNSLRLSLGQSGIVLMRTSHPALLLMLSRAIYAYLYAGQADNMSSGPGKVHRNGLPLEKSPTSEPNKLASQITVLTASSGFEIEPGSYPEIISGAYRMRLGLRFGFSHLRAAFAQRCTWHRETAPEPQVC